MAVEHSALPVCNNFANVVKYAENKNNHHNFISLKSAYNLLFL